MSGDGRDVAAALQTIREIGDDRTLDAAIEQAFPGSELVIAVNDGHFGEALTSPATLVGRHLGRQHLVGWQVVSDLRARQTIRSQLTKCRHTY